MMDTSVAIHLRDGTPEVVEKTGDKGGEALISIVTHVELEGGVYRDPSQTSRRRARLDALLEGLTILPFDEQSAQAYRSILEAAGFSRPRILDRMIAAQAISAGLPLITMNAADFRDIPNLVLEDWGPSA
ncbi:MAG TPA: type II toxin-antitoxin system VapC family toxin [Allosphingosinicella sp.]|nr:type II toxin-antitoxin system VapC family toxin [Allosphingosinicella sp.]